MVRSNVTVNLTPQFSVFSASQLEELHSASLEVLERTGMLVHDEEALALLKSAGANVDEGGHVRIPSALTERALRSAPTRISLSDRGGAPAIVLEGNKSYFGTGSDCPNILDSVTHERRPFTKADVETGARICDSLPNIDFLMSQGLISDALPATSDLHQFHAMVLNTKKPIVFTAHNQRNLASIIEMAEAARGGEAIGRRPFIVLYDEPITPLVHPEDSVQKLMLTAEKRVPTIYTPCPMAGATTPVTLASTIVVGNAEFLGGLVMGQLKNEGAPMICGGVTTIMDLRTTQISYGAPEFVLASAAITNLAHYYKIPVFSTAGCSDSKAFDQQAAIEASISSMIAALSGANLIHDVGYLESALTDSFDMLVMSDEIIGMAKRIVRGIEVSDVTLALDLIHEAGPGGQFFGSKHTVDNFRKEQWFPTLMDRSTYETWDGRTMGDRIAEKVKTIAEQHHPAPLPDEVQERLGGIIAARESEG